MASVVDPHDHYVTYEVRVRQTLDPLSYGHLDGDLTPQVMADSDIHDFLNGGMMLEELLMSTDGEMEIKAVKFEDVPEEVDEG